jgi:hypothetical protein
MRYNAVYQYVNTDHTNYNAAKFCLRLSVLANPEHDEGGVTIAPQKKKNHFEGRWGWWQRWGCGEQQLLHYTAKTQQTRRSQTTAQKKESNNQPWFSFWCSGSLSEQRERGESGWGSGHDGVSEEVHDDEKCGLDKAGKQRGASHQTGTIHQPIRVIWHQIGGRGFGEDEGRAWNDPNRTIWFHLVFNWLLPKFGKGLDKDKVGFYKFVVAKMQTNYMIQIMQKRAFLPEYYYYDPYDKKNITAEHVARFFGCQLVRAIKGLPSIRNCWSMRKSLDAIGTAKKSMPRGAFSDMQRCMHFADMIGRRKMERFGAITLSMRSSSHPSTLPIMVWCMPMWDKMFPC